MTLVLKETTYSLLAPTVKGEAATLEEALALVPGEILLYEEDAENPGFFDLATKDLRLFVIEPKPLDR